MMSAEQLDFGWGIPQPSPQNDAVSPVTDVRSITRERSGAPYQLSFNQVAIAPILEEILTSPRLERRFARAHRERARAIIDEVYEDAYYGDLDRLRDLERRVALMQRLEGEDEQVFEAVMDVLDHVVDELNKVIVDPIHLFDLRVARYAELRMNKQQHMQGANWFEAHKREIRNYLYERLRTREVDWLDLALCLIFDNGVTQPAHPAALLNTLSEDGLVLPAGWQCPYCIYAVGRERHGLVLGALAVRMLHRLRENSATPVDVESTADLLARICARLRKVCDVYAIPWPANRRGMRWIFAGLRAWYGMRYPPYLQAVLDGHWQTTDIRMPVLWRIMNGTQISVAGNAKDGRSQRRRRVREIDTRASWAAPFRRLIEEMDGIRSWPQITAFKAMLKKPSALSSQGWDQCVYAYFRQKTARVTQSRSKGARAVDVVGLWMAELYSVQASLRDEFEESFAAGNQEAWHQGLMHVGQYGGRRTFRRIYGLYRFVARHLGWTVSPMGEFIAFRGGSAVDANFISYEEFCRVRTASQYEPTWTSDEREIVMLALELGFFAGLRWSECLGLRLRDIKVVGSGVYVDVVRTSDRSLKTGNAVRRLPYHVLADADAVTRLIERRQAGRSPDALLLSDDILGFSVLSARLAPYLNNRLRRILKDSTIRYHHLRHSFANWVLAALTLDEEGRQMLCATFATEHPILTTARRDQLIQEAFGAPAPPGAEPRGPMLVAQLLGHLEPVTTLRSYVHITPFVIARYRLTLESRDTPELNCAVFGVGRSQGFARTKWAHGRASLLDPGVVIRRPKGRKNGSSR